MSSTHTDETEQAPAPGTEERDFWLEAAVQHGFEETTGGEHLAEYDPPAYFATEDEVISLMAACRAQGRKDALSPRSETVGAGTETREVGAWCSLQQISRVIDARLSRGEMPGGNFPAEWWPIVAAGLRAALAPAAQVNPAGREEIAYHAWICREGEGSRQQWAAALRNATLSPAGYYGRAVSAAFAAADAILAARPGADGVAIPESWKLVPCKPTRAMLEAVARQVDDFSREHARLFSRDIWAAMLAETPATAPTTQSVGGTEA